MGKAHCEYFCLSGGSHTSAMGPVHNPYKYGYSAGGSSSGSGALVGAGEVDMAIGGDQGGSIRMPSCWSGCYGMKPTHGLVPYTGVMPIEATIDHTGPMTQTVADNALFLEVIAGADGLDPRQYNVRVDKYTTALGRGVAGLRIGVVNEGFGRPESEADVDQKVREAAERLRALGAAVENVSIPMHLDGPAIWTPIALEGLQAQMMYGNGMGFNWEGLYTTSLLDAHANWRARANELSRTLKISMLVGTYFIKHYRGHFYAKAQNLARVLRQGYDDALSRYDLLLMPTLPMKATPIPPQNAPLALWCQRALRDARQHLPVRRVGPSGDERALRHEPGPADRHDAGRRATTTSPPSIAPRMRSSSGRLANMSRRTEPMLAASVFSMRTERQIGTVGSAACTPSLMGGQRVAGEECQTPIRWSSGRAISVHASNPFSSDWLSADRDERLRPQRGLSYVAGPADDPLRFITIPAAARRSGGCARGARRGDLRRHAARAGPGTTCSERRDEVAAGLLALGIKRGDRVGIWAPNCEEWLGLQFGTARIGAILVNINPAYRESELEYALNKVQCRVLVMARALKSSDYVAILRATRAGDRPDAARRQAAVRAAAAPAPCGADRRRARCPPASTSFRTFRTLAGPAQQARLASLSRSARPRRRDQHPVHQRHDRRAEGRHAEPLQRRQQRALSRRRPCGSPRATGCASRYRCTTASGWCWACSSAWPPARRWCSRHRASTPQQTLRAVSAQWLHGSAWGAVDVHRPARASARCARPMSRRCAPGIMAGAPCPIETMRRVVGGAAYVRGHYRLRHDRDEPGVIPVQHR